MFEELLGVNPWTALFTLLNTLTIYFVGRKYLFGPVMKLINDRQQEIDKLYSDADAVKSEAETLRCAYAQKLSKAKSTSECIVKEATARGQAREEEIIRKASADAAAIMDKASAEIAQEKKKALNDAKNEISEIAMAIAEKVVSRELTAADQNALVDSFLDELGDLT